MPIQSVREKTTGCKIFCLHLLVYCGLVTAFFYPLGSSLTVHLKVAHILLLPLMVSAPLYL